jgi:uncharacterized peroxidase-related enzyme
VGKEFHQSGWVDSLLRARNVQQVRLHTTLTPGERELIATYVSSQNNCYFCQTSHGAAAACHLGGEEVVRRVKTDFESAPVSPKLKALLAIAGKVQRDGKLVTHEDVERARREGASDLEIHDTVLIAAAFCMYNRYVDGLDSGQPRDPDVCPDGPAPGRERLSEIFTRIVSNSRCPKPEAIVP